MNIKTKSLIALLCVSFSLSVFATITEKDLDKKIKAIEKKNNTIIGLTAIHIENNTKIAHNNTQRFFMASTIKVPIALAFLHRVDEKKESLNRVIKMDTKNSVPGSGSLYHIFEKKTTNMSTQQILKHMLINSDNSASDTILHAANGPKYVTQYMANLGFKNIVVNRSILEMFLDTNHVDHSLLNKGARPVFSWQKIFNSVPLSQKANSWQKFQNDKRDTTTSDEMAKLLVKLQKNQILSESSTQLVLKIMQDCRTGRSRIRGLLPGGVKVAHKTGTWAIQEANYLRYPGSKKLFRFASDVGIITLPNNKGHVAIAVYVKSKSASDYPRSRSIALASRAIYDYFMQKPAQLVKKATKPSKTKRA
ncbi:class A beta-lactamase [Legionella sp. km772]|uniref:class A beta-lactamase n=1 Tax=Legionella sp. km772 TaxID=2498111 RepID=UPI000F8CE495|nr:class A beta-lactamase [Legionella sp. km772]RUR07203.1 class A beta-lactamase [Legionella sp. km772]